MKKANGWARDASATRPGPELQSLYWVEVSLPAPAVEGAALRFVRFVSGESPLPHGDSSASFSFRADKPPEHKVRITVIDSKTELPIEGVEVRLGPYQA